MDNVIEFVKTAAEGGFEISKEGGDHLLKAIDKFQDWIDDQSDRINMLEQDRKLGTSNGAKVLGPFVQQVANDDLGFATQLFALRDSLHKASEGIRLAMDQYQRTEDANRAELKNIAT